MIEAGRIYPETHWAVRRWDHFHGGRFVVPKSFCQFWRTVVLWATLQQIPFAGGMFVPPSARPAKPIRLPAKAAESEREAWDPFRSKYARSTGAIVWGVLLPVRLLIMLIVKGAQTAVAFVEERPVLKRRLWYGYLGLIVLLGLSMAAILLWMLIDVAVTIWIPWLLDLPVNVWWTVAGCIVAAPFALAGLYLIAVTAFKGTATAAKIAFDGGGVVWDALVTGKKAICPPMRIVRTAQQEDA